MKEKDLGKILGDIVKSSKTGDKSHEPIKPEAIHPGCAGIVMERSDCCNAPVEYPRGEL